jgi:SAM-dependent methyltransferase
MSPVEPEVVEQQNVSQTQIGEPQIAQQQLDPQQIEAGQPAGARPYLPLCPLCRGVRLHYAFGIQGFRAVRCADCRLLMLNPQPSDAELGSIYTDAYFLGSGEDEGPASVSAMKAATARLYLDLLRRYRGAHGGRLLEIGCGHGDFLVEAEKAGYDVTGIEYALPAAHRATARLGQGRVLCGEVSSLRPGSRSFDVCVIADVIEHTRNPRAFLDAIHGLLAPGGVLFIATPSLDSWSARVMGTRWMELKPEHLFYFDRSTLQSALQLSQFNEVYVGEGQKVLSADYVVSHFDRYPVPGFTPLVRLLGSWLPRSLGARPVTVVASGVVVCARAAEAPARRRLSVIVPVFNEAQTVRAVLDALLRKRLADVDIDLIIVESNSTDGSRDAVLEYQGAPRVTIVLEERPRGKGHAVRAGLARATGDYILIQDADLEYDFEDYDALIEPLVAGRQAFVLGSRHGGSTLKMRQFADQRLAGFALNIGHWFFTLLVNVLFGVRLKDPFTMFKVFRRDCLFGLEFTCNRFDFDYELLIKLVRKGYRPIEIPVNYRSRSFKAGKKVSVFHDPMTWLVVLARLRLTKLDPLAVIERLRRSAPLTRN